MAKRLIYLDHAATNWPKPPAVLDAVRQYLEKAGNPGRGSHRLAAYGAEMIYTCRERAAALFDASPENVICTSGATAAINLILQGWLQTGDHVLVDGLAHNAVYRPLYRLAARGEIDFDLVAPGNSVEAWIDHFERLRQKNTRMVVLTHGSNICSSMAPLHELGLYCRERGLLLVVDGAQSGGHVPISVREDGIDALCLPGHKGLLGPQGCGLLILGEDVPLPEAVLVGGSGSHSLEPVMPEDLPEHLEAGTLPGAALAGLSEGMGILLTEGLSGAHERLLANRFVSGCGHFPGVQLYGSADGSVISFTVAGLLPSQVGELLDTHGILVRCGYHCAPVAHRTIGSFATGTVRVSFGRTNTVKEVDRVLSVLEQIVHKL